ncbi:hypothetical protein AX279_08735 [Pseudomonas sp. J237]|nr:MULTISPECIES: hypothetical protein [Pseudomonas]OEO26869.1 hypothetical protein AX279_08735 [Pseudomonas sp. J237]
MKIICSQRILRLPNKAEIHIPFGLSKFYKSALSYSDAVFTLDANKVVSIKVNESLVQVYPYYCKAISIPKLPPLTFSIVVSEKDKKACSALISRVHYLSPPNRGIFFALKERDKIIACCILDTLKFGNPKGRYYINTSLYDDSDINPENWGNTPYETHNALQEQLKLIWVSRIAKVQEYSGHQIGTRLMLETLKAIPAVLPFPVQHVEVIRTCGVEESLSRDFLEHAGFTKIKLRNQSTAPYISDGDLFPKRKPCVKLYYWSKITNTSCVEIARLFVPLSQAPYLWFANNTKTWELRSARGQFTERHIYPGRPVELRLGYNTNKKLWGIINKVITGTSIESVLKKIGSFQSVIPTASSLEDATEKAHSILKASNNSYIAFEVTALFNPDDLTCHA